MATVTNKKTTSKSTSRSNGASKNGSTKSAKGSKSKISKETYLEWYELMLRIRRFEEAALMSYGQQKIRGFLHVYIGQEAIAAGLKSALRHEDPIVTAYRQHGIGLMRGLSSKGCMAELYGKFTGVNKGKGGSMHFFSKENNYFGGNGIVGAQIPIGTGIGFAEKYKGTDNLCVTMFGDGASRQGALYESFNMAMAWKLPVLYICENNHYGMGTSVERITNVTDIYKIGSAFDMPSEPVDGMDPEAVHDALAKAAEHIRAGNGPYFLEIKTYRYKGHSVSDPGLYRSKDEVKDYMDKDPVKVLEAKIVDEKIASQEEIDNIKDAIKAEIKEALQFAEESDYPPASELYTDNYLQEDYPFIKD
ncbi:MAG: pyruvate dehydrogenase (acetyl-transferring) E1 component subunit alpha [Saprospiraceae bacterium]